MKTQAGRVTRWAGMKAGLAGLATDPHCRSVKVWYQQLGIPLQVAGIGSTVQKVSVSLVSLRSTDELEVYKEHVSKRVKKR